jgi:hypothetical protein
MFVRHSKSAAILVALAIICLTAACALNRASSKLSDRDRRPVAGFPGRVGVATLVGNLTAQEEATNRFSRGLVDLGFQVVTRSSDLDRVLRRSADGVSENIPEEIRKRLEARYGLEGIFVGILSQDKGRIIDETRLSLRLLSIATGKLVWSTDVVGDAVIGLSPTVKEMAVAAVEKALQSLEKEIYPPPVKPGQASSTPGLQKTPPKKSD